MNFLAGGGTVGALMRAHDWHSSPLGPPESWPQSLRSMVGLLLNSKFPMFLAWGEELRFLYNDAYAEILGRKHPKALGGRFADIWSEIWSDISPLIDAALQGEAVYREDLPLLMNRSGYDEHTWFTFSYSPVRDESGAVAGMFCAVAETTSQILAKGALKRLNDELETRVAEALAERKLFADLLAGADTPVAVADLDYRWLAVNPAAVAEFERIYGVRPVIGCSMLDQLADRPEHRAALEAVWSRALGGEAYTIVEPFGDEARDRPVYELRFHPLRDISGRQIGAYVFVYDVTERLQEQARLTEAEEILRQSQKLDALGQLTGGVAHDFNNLLTPIFGALDMLRRRLEEDERAQRMIAGALQAAERARILIQRLLAFARRQHLTPCAVDVCDLVQNMGQLLSRSLGPRIELEIDIPEDRATALVDPNQLELALLNLAVNARDAMDGEGKLTIAVRRESLPANGKRAAGDYMRVSVTDTGMGMDEEILRRAVEPFFTTKDIGRGTGLGLSSVQGLAEQSGGAFALFSKPGQGTTAALWLPVSTELARAEEIAVAPLEIAHADATPILLVDDEDLVRVGTADMLAEAGYRVTEAGSAYQALELLKKGIAAELLITDYAMPGMTGAQLAREARALRPGLEVLMITGYAASMDLDAGSLARLAKPFRQADLAAAVANLMTSRNSSSQRAP